MPYSPRRVGQEWRVEAPASVIWDILSHTDKLNRAVGLPAVQPGPLGEGELTRRVEARYLGLVPMAWIEFPFEWVRDRSYQVQRDYLRGPLLRFVGGIVVEPEGSGSRVRAFADITPRNLLGRLLVPVVGRQSLERTWEYCRRVLDQEIRSADRPPSEPGRAARSRADPALIGERAARLVATPPLDAGVVAALLHHLASAGDEEVVRMQPYALAARWRTDPHATLRVFLHTTRAGLLNLMWELLCPNCRVPKAEHGALAEVARRFHCDTCGIGYDATLDRYVELRFRVHPAVRPAQDQVYCFGGPFSAPHILVQHLLRSGETREVAVTLGPEPYRLRSLRVNAALPMRPEDAAPSLDATVSYGPGGWRKRDLAFRPGPARLRWTNETDRPVALVLERLRWDERAMTAAEVAALQEFRDLFSSEVLAPGQEIGVESVTVLFSDLKGSTRLYEETGDAPAYGQVRRHFDYLKERVAAARGAVVKTIGDAVMAVFFRPADAVACALAIQGDLGAFNEAAPAQPPLVVKLGLHHGPAIAIQANGRLDYFGRTVNVAARLLRESRGGDLVVAQELAEMPEVRTVLGREKAAVQEVWTSTLPGLARPLTLCRVRRA